MKPSEQQLRDEIALREASVEDARRELAAGELPVLLAATIEARELTALASARAALESLEYAQSPLVRKRRRRRWLLVVGLLCLFLAAVIWLIASIGPRQPGTQETGGLSLSDAQTVQQHLGEAQADIASGDVGNAIAAYEEVLAIDAKNVTALTELGWLDFSAGSQSANPNLVQSGVADLRAAISYGPLNAAPRLYYAIVADKTPGNEATATAQFRIFLKLHPTSAQLAIAEPYLRQLHLAT